MNNININKILNQGNFETLSDEVRTKIKSNYQNTDTNEKLKDKDFSKEHFKENIMKIIDNYKEDEKRENIPRNSKGEYMTNCWLLKRNLKEYLDLNKKDRESFEHFLKHDKWVLRDLSRNKLFANDPLRDIVMKLELKDELFKYLNERYDKDEQKYRKEHATKLSEQLYNRELPTVDISLYYVSLKLGRFKNIAKAVKTRSLIKSIKFESCQLDDRHYEDILEMLRENPFVQEINLGHNLFKNPAYYDYEKKIETVDILDLNYNKSLVKVPGINVRELNLKNCGADNIKGFLDLSRLIYKESRLEKLVLSEIRFSNSIFTQLSELLNITNNLKELELSPDEPYKNPESYIKNEFNDSTVENFGRALAKNETLKYLTIEFFYSDFRENNSGMDYDTTEASRFLFKLFSQLKNNKSLEKLILDGCDINDSVGFIKEFIQGNANLKYLDMSDNTDLFHDKIQIFIDLSKLYTNVEIKLPKMTDVSMNTDGLKYNNLGL